MAVVFEDDTFLDLNFITERISHLFASACLEDVEISPHDLNPASPSLKLVSHIVTAIFIASGWYCRKDRRKNECDEIPDEFVLFATEVIAVAESRANGTIFTGLSNYKRAIAQFYIGLWLNGFVKMSAD